MAACRQRGDNPTCERSIIHVVSVSVGTLWDRRKPCARFCRASKDQRMGSVISPTAALYCAAYSPGSNYLKVGIDCGYFA